MLEYIKLSEYAKIKGIHYRTAVRHYHDNKIEGYTNDYGHIFVKNPQ